MGTDKRGGLLGGWLGCGGFLKLWDGVAAVWVEGWRGDCGALDCWFGELAWELGFGME